MSEEEILQNIRLSKESREKAIRSLFNNPQLRAGLQKVLSLSENSIEFQDIFNLTLVQFMKTVIRNKEFSITSNLHSYLFVIARNILIAKNNKSSLKTSNLDDINEDIRSNHKDIDLHIINDETRAMLKGMLGRMGRNCYEILWNWASGYSMKEIAQKLQYNTEEVVRRKKYLCLKRLSLFLDENPNIKNLFR